MDSKFTISRGLFTDTAHAVLEPPDDDHIRRVSDIPNVTYFPTHIPSRWQGSVLITDAQVTVLKKEGYNVTDRFYQEMVEQPLGKRIFEEFEGKKILLRGIGCSIGEHIEMGTVIVKNIAEIMRDGCEFDEKNATAVTKFDTDKKNILFLTTLWLKKSARNVRNLLGGTTKEAKQIYPVVLVYDATKLQKSRGDYAYMFPQTAALRAQVILKAYITDYPV
ncbi:MAG: hypothetical protein KBD46_01515 [Candidatus Levybacteria bacterium]|nr:hypothetical protein [Candidatus Levybacteria bacterium]